MVIVHLRSLKGLKAILEIFRAGLCKIAQGLRPCKRISMDHPAKNQHPLCQQTQLDAL